MATTAERQAQSLARAERRAEQLHTESDRLLQSGMADFRQMDGQPVLIGHHSEKRHRNAIRKADAKLAKSSQLHKEAKAAEWTAAMIANRPAILATDDDAVENLTNKAKLLEDKRKAMVAMNAAWRKFQKTNDRTVLYDAGLNDRAVDELIAEIDKRYSWEKQPYPASSLQLIGASIRDARKRAERITETRAIPTTETEINGVTVTVNTDMNRVQLFFPGRPNPAQYQRLKQHGFRWTPSLGCWQQHLNAYKVQVANEIAALAGP